MKEIELYERAMKIRKEISNLEKEYEEYIKQYRLKSVDRVLSFIRSEYCAGRIHNLDTLLCHC